MSREGKPVQGRLYRGADGVWRSRADVEREVRKIRAAILAAYRREHPVEALAADCREVLAIVRRLDPAAAEVLAPLVDKAFPTEATR